MPIVRPIYKTMKQIFEALFSKSGSSFRQAALVEFPAPGMWSLVFLSQAPGGDVAGKLPKGEHVSAFMPCTPNPTTGFFFYVLRKDLIVLDITVEEAMTLLISAGMVQPDGDAQKNLTALAATARKAQAALRNREEIKARRLQVSLALRLPAEPRILVVTMRRLGDVLLTTPLVRALRRGLPGSRIDMLVFSGSEGILAGNPDIERVIAFPERARMAESIALFRKIWRRYDIAISTQAGDRPTFLAGLPGVLASACLTGAAAWKSWLLNRPVMVDREVHRVTSLLRLVALGIEGGPMWSCPRRGVAATRSYAVIHAKPMHRVAMDRPGLARAGRRSLNAGSRWWRPADRRRTSGPISMHLEFMSGAGRAHGRPARLGELAALLSSAAVYVGTDTSMSHLAAAAGCPTVTIFGRLRRI
jgi:hypothetical protein